MTTYSQQNLASVPDFYNKLGQISHAVKHLHGHPKKAPNKIQVYTANTWSYFIVGGIGREDDASTWCSSESGFEFGWERVKTAVQRIVSILSNPQIKSFQLWVNYLTVKKVEEKMYTIWPNLVDPYVFFPQMLPGKKWKELYWRNFEYWMSLYAVALQFPLTGTKGPQLVHNPWRNPCAQNKVHGSTRLVWRNSSGLPRTLTLKSINTFGMNWNADCTPGFPVQ